MSKNGAQNGISAPTFWEQYKRKPLGMVGLFIVLVYIFVAIFAPFLTPYNPKQILLADRIAAPVWFRSVVPQYNDAPSTVRTDLGPNEWTVSEATGGKLSSQEQDGKTITVIGFDPVFSGDVIVEGEADAFEDSEFADAYEKEPDMSVVELSYVVPYTYSPPKTFGLTFNYWIDASPDSKTELQFVIETPEGKEFNLWGKSYSGALGSQPARIDSRDLTLKQRLGLTIFDDPAPRIFSSKGDYRLVLTAKATSGEEPTRVCISDTVFYIPGMVHGVLGADHMGADLWAQLVYGTRISLSIGLSAAAISVAVGTAVGIICGYLGGVVDEFMMRVVDVLMAIPTLPILIILGAILGKSVWNIVLLISAFAWMGTARLVRSQTLSLRERVFVEAAKASGASDAYVMITHILPNVLPLVFAGMVLRIPSAILTEASLSFLGLGDPRVATWGRMLHNARGFGAFTTLAWWWLVPPGLAITFLSLAFVFIGNTVNEILNPRYRERS
jgi:peptide/nickel transport system permease protein